MKVLFLHIVIISLTGFNAAIGQVKKLVKINTQTSYVEIHGTTNVNSFNCSYNAKLPENEFEVTLIKKGNVIEIEHEALFLKVLNFKCPNPQMTDDLHDLLEYENYPFIIFQVKKITNNKTGHIMIEMAGETHSYTVNLNNSLQNNQLISNATMELCITDFGLQAPEKFFGMVKVNENIEVEFKIDLNIYDK
ncbi:YceI family protein [Marivirga salinae]|uniref:YceI family protein n=1 Tax=Marivirga salinarum TaxID=3059078 RepID=A0AA49GB71_9BACT|nr:YceI family protein [Marivirga sp. BDSF4-3]WKK76546.2 YceI family protein [Marivirga sp. BDSF4-3]